MAGLALLLASLARNSGSAAAPEGDPYRDKVVPFLKDYCVRCHDAKTKKGELDLSRFDTSAKILEDFRQWEHVVGFLKKEEMPPAKAKQPTAALRKEIVETLEKVLLAEARKLAGDPGVVPPRRLTNAEYDATIHDLTGADIQAAKSFPVDPASGEGFNNTGEALVMSPSLFKKYYAAAEHVAEHAVLTTEGLRFAPHPAVAFADRQKHYEQAILRFYEKHAVDPEKHLVAIWQRKARPDAEWAKKAGLSPRYAIQLWELLEGKTEDRHVVGWLRSRWKAAANAGEVRALANDIRRLSKALTPVETPAIVANAGNGPVEHLARRRRTAETRDTFDAGHLSVQKHMMDWRGKIVLRSDVPVLLKASVTQPGKKRMAMRELLPAETAAKLKPVKGDESILDGTLEIDLPEKNKGTLYLEFSLAGPGKARVSVGKADALPLPPLVSPADPGYEASAAAFCRLFPSRFFHVDSTRGLSAGFHLIEGFFRDDQPLCRSVLDAAEKKELDRLWTELYFVTGIWEKMLRGFVFFERSERNFLKHKDFDAFKEEDPDLVKDEALVNFKETYLRRSNVKLAGDALAKHPVSVFFDDIREGLKRQAATTKRAEPLYLKDLLAFAEKAYRRPLTTVEQQKLEKFYADACHDKSHGTDAAVRASITRILVSPQFCMRFAAVQPGESVAPLSDLELASRLSYFVWSGPPDDELLSLAKAGKLREALRGQVRRIVRDPKVGRFAREFFGQWLGYRDFLTQEAVNRMAFPAFDDSLKQAMFEEPTRLATHLIQEDRPITNLLDGDTTFVNRKLAQHYGLPWKGEDEWRSVDGLKAKGRGGLLGMAVFLTKNSQPQRTSPVKRGFWVVHKVLGEHIPPPPPDVAVLPAKETDTKGKTIRQLLKLHVDDAKCASCHRRFDPVGLAMEGFDAIGRARTKDLAGRAIDDMVSLPDGKEARGVPAFADHLAKHRVRDFTRTLVQKFLGYALGRSLQLSDQPLLERMQAELEKAGKMSSLFDLVASSPQFRDQRCKDFTPSKFKAVPPPGAEK